MSDNFLCVVSNEKYCYTLQVHDKVQIPHKALAIASCYSEAAHYVDVYEPFPLSVQRSQLKLNIEAKHRRT